MPIKHFSPSLSYHHHSFLTSKDFGDLDVQTPSKCIPSLSTTSQIHQHCFYHPNIIHSAQLHHMPILTHTILSCPSCHPVLQAVVPTERLRRLPSQHRQTHPESDSVTLLPFKCLPNHPSTKTAIPTCVWPRPELQQSALNHSTVRGCQPLTH